MSRPVAVLRPEPGNGATARRLAGAGLTPLPLPLFEVVALAWTAPDALAHDALILTSANTVRHGGAALAALTALPVFAVGEATAAAARAMGFAIAAVGQGNASDLLAHAKASGVRHALHLGGRDGMVEAGGIVANTIPVYASEARPIDPAAFAALADAVILVHSARAGERLAQLADEHALNRSTTRIVAISAAAGRAAGSGWARRVIAARPDDAAMIDAARALAN